jgi:DnaA-homolog protein
VIAQQLPLPVQLPVTAEFESFIAGANTEPLQALTLGESAYLQGPEGSGKSHLLMAAARHHRGRYLPLSAALDAGADLLEGLDTAVPLALDELELAPQAADFAQALLRLLDRRRQAASPTWLAAREAPEGLSYLPADLRTRLALWPRYRLHPLDDHARSALLADAARRRGLQLSEEVIAWWLRHLPRDPASLLGALARLDRAALRAQRRPSLPFVRAILGADVPDAPDARTAPSP